VSLFRGAVTQSPFTNQFGATLSNVKNGVEYEDLSKIINLFDIYVQYANCEGFGLPQVEAAACGVPVMATDYSAMESVVRNLKGIPIKPKTLYKELETGCLRAVPDNDLAANKLLEFFNLTNAERNKMSQETREAFIEHYQWNKSGDAWANYFDSVDILPDNESWYSPPRIRQPEPKPQSLPPNLSFKQISNWLISSVLCEPKLLNSHMQARIIRDLMYGSSTSTTGGMYFNESSAAFDGKMARSQFDFNTAYDYMVALCNRRNFWEQKRIEAIKQ
jgi:hypothetical protein